MAGIYDLWQDSEGKKIPSFTIIATTPNDFMPKIHDRRPMILNQKDESVWLDWQADLIDILIYCRYLNPALKII